MRRMHNNMYYNIIMFSNNILPILPRHISHNTPVIRLYREVYTLTQTQEKRTCVAGQKQIVQLVVVVVVGGHGGGGGVQLDLLEHLRRQRIRVILQIIKKNAIVTHRRSHNGAVHITVARNTIHRPAAVRAPCSFRIEVNGWGEGKEYGGAVSPKAFDENRAKNILHAGRVTLS